MSYQVVITAGQSEQMQIMAFLFRTAGSCQTRVLPLLDEAINYIQLSDQIQQPCSWLVCADYLSLAKTMEQRLHKVQQVLSGLVQCRQLSLIIITSQITTAERQLLERLQHTYRALHCCPNPLAASQLLQNHLEADWELTEAQATPSATT